MSNNWQLKTVPNKMRFSFLFKEYLPNLWSSAVSENYLMNKNHSHGAKAAKYKETDIFLFLLLVFLWDFLTVEAFSVENKYLLALWQNVCVCT